MANETGFDLSSLFSGGLGGTPSGLDALLTEDALELPDVVA